VRPELSSIERTLPFGNGLVIERVASQRRARKARRIRWKSGHRTVPGPF
jgi:hypothetical protein